MFVFASLSTIDMHTERNIRMIRADLAREKKENEANAIMILRLKAQVANIEMQQAITAADLEKKNVEFFGVRAESERYQALLRLVSEEKETLLLELHDMKQKEKEAKSIAHRFYRRKHGAMARMCGAFGWSSIRKEKGWAEALTGRTGREDSDLLDGAIGFWLGSQKEGVSTKEGRAGRKFRKELLYDIVRFGNKGELWEEIKKDVAKEIRADPAVIAKAQDVGSAFNPRALQGLRECLPGYAKGKHGLVIPSQTCVNVPKEEVRAAAESEFGSIFPEEHEGCLWKWDMKKGVHAYLKRKYYDLRYEDISGDTPWMITVTGDAAKVGRSACATVCGLKVVDPRHPEQNGTGKVMNQSPSTYTPTICAVKGE